AGSAPPRRARDRHAHGRPSVADDAARRADAAMGELPGAGAAAPGRTVAGIPRRVAFRGRVRRERADAAGRTRAHIVARTPALAGEDTAAGADHGRFPGTGPAPPAGRPAGLLAPPARRSACVRGTSGNRNRGTPAG